MNMRFGKFKTWLLVVSVALSAAGRSHAVITPEAPIDPAGRVPEEIQKVGVDEHLGDSIPLDAVFINDRGESLPLSSYLHHGRPIVLQLGYFECPMLCSLVSHGLIDSAKELGLKAGTDFDMLFVSIDPAETPSLAALKKQNTVEYYGKKEESPGFHFLVGKAAPILQLCNSVGFKFQQLADTQQFAHAAVIMVLTPDGKVSRYLYGTKFSPQTLRLSLVEASDNKIGSTMDRILLVCLHYDAATGKYAWAATMLMRLGGGLTIAILGSVLFVLFRKDYKAARAKGGSVLPNPKLN